ncbi:hypothetical protein ETB97_012702 [Aspergillus alliaceus]|uniref:Uncharacterized protein n=1 Tax=Petromyces alliaceus TaxID=209559 RepID=A0A8H6A4W5_PETAA|nr:hypothetical protein ETB97_012702 [Aspergillus burnettii]
MSHQGGYPTILESIAKRGGKFVGWRARFETMRSSLKLSKDIGETSENFQINTDSWDRCETVWNLDDR